MKQTIIALFLLVAIASEGQSRQPMMDSRYSGFDYLLNYSSRIDMALMELEEKVKNLERKTKELQFSLEQERTHQTLERTVDTANDLLFKDAFHYVDSAVQHLKEDGFHIWATSNYILRAGETEPYWIRRHDPTGTRFTDKQLWKLYKRRHKI